jgi:hypothetical protein
MANEKKKQKHIQNNFTFCTLFEWRTCALHMLKRALSSFSSPSSYDLVHARDLDAEERSMITSLFIQIAGSGSGKILNEFRDDLLSACYLQNTNCIHDAYGVGRFKVLGADGKMLMTEFVLHKSALNERRLYLAIQEFLDQVLCISNLINSARLYYDANGLLNQVAKVRSA